MTRSFSATGIRRLSKFSASSASVLISHSAAARNSGKRRFGKVPPLRGKSSWITPFLKVLMASSFWMPDVISSSRDDRQSAIFCCSESDREPRGSGTGVAIRSSSLTCSEPCARAPIEMRFLNHRPCKLTEKSLSKKAGTT
ncbi:hypothetical protein D9M68_729590 [compost metagenome]